MFEGLERIDLEGFSASSSDFYPVVAEISTKMAMLPQGVFPG